MDLCHGMRSLLQDRKAAVPLLFPPVPPMYILNGITGVSPCLCLDCLCQIFLYVQHLPLFFDSPLMLYIGFMFKFKHWTTQMTCLPEDFEYCKKISEGDDKWHNEEKEYMMLNTISTELAQSTHIILKDFQNWSLFHISSSNGFF